MCARTAIALVAFATATLSAVSCKRASTSEPEAANAHHPLAGELYVVLTEMTEIASDVSEEAEPEARLALEHFGDRAVEIADELKTDAAFRERLRTLTARMPEAQMHWIDDEAAGLRGQFATSFRLPSPPKNTDAIEGAHLYATSCAPCHGANGEPSQAVSARMNPPPANLRMLARAADFDPAWVYLVVAHGIPTTPMPSFQHALADQDRWNIASYIRSMQ